MIKLVVFIALFAQASCWLWWGKTTTEAPTTTAQPTTTPRTRTTTRRSQWRSTTTDDYDDYFYNRPSSSSSTTSRYPTSRRTTKSSSSNQNPNYDYLVLALNYPPSMCIVQNNRFAGTCVVPSNFKGWTTYGLWPSNYDGQGPNDCHSSNDAFDRDAVDSVGQDLVTYWPNIIVGGSNYGYWSYEWKKHGVCAIGGGPVSGVKNYFSQVVQLNKQLNMAKILSDANIKPGTKTYMFSDFLDAVKKATTKNSASLQCVKDTSTSTWYIAAIRVCLDQNLDFIDCPTMKRFKRKASAGKLPGLQDCPKKLPISYPTRVSN